MTNQEIAKLLKEVAAAYILKNENRFKIIAYEKAADAIQNSTMEAKDLWESGKLSAIPGIGTSIASHLDELFRTGKVKHFVSIKKGLPSSLFPLLVLSGFGPKKAYKLVSILKLNNPTSVVEDLFKAAKQGKIEKIEGFGEKSQQDILEAIEAFKKGEGKSNRMPLPFAYALAQEMIDYLQKDENSRKVVPLGSLRRMVSTIGDIDLAVATRNPKEVIDWFIKYPRKEKVIEQGQSGAAIVLHNGKQIDLRVQSPESFGAMLQYFTGSKSHNIKLRELALKQGLSLSEYGIRKIKNQKSTCRTGRSKIKNRIIKDKLYEYSTEEEFYRALGLPWIPPELREDWGEIEAVQKKQLPKLVELKDIKGDLHIHSNYNLEPSHDLGYSSLKEILISAQNLGYEYIGISDHNPSYTNHTDSQIIEILKTRKTKYEQILQSTKSVRVKLFTMLEVDILPDGKLAIPEKAFEYLDAAIVSIHSSFKMTKEEMTKRILKGLSHPKAKILAHPTGRLIGKREGYEVDFEKLFKFAKENNKAIEINAYPDRLDLPDILVKEAVGEKVKLVIDTDSHEQSSMDLMTYGVSVARRGWAKKDDIVNTLPYNKIKDWLSK
jgi:DNA polymerase (family 10)